MLTASLLQSLTRHFTSGWYAINLTKPDCSIDAWFATIQMLLIRNRQNTVIPPVSYAASLGHTSYSYSYSYSHSYSYGYA